MKKQIKIETVLTNVKTNSAAIKGMAMMIDELRKSINRVANQNPKMIAGINEMAKHMTKLKTETHGTTVKLGVMLYTVNQLHQSFGMLSSRLVNFGMAGAKSLFEVASSFEYIKAGLDFAFGSRSQMVMSKALDAAQEMNISTREVLDVTRSLGVLKIDPFSQMRLNSGKTQVALKSLADLAALVPQQGMQGALFAIRNALSGQWRSLQMRFDIPLNMIEDMRKGITEAMNQQQRFDVIMQGVTRHFGGLMSSVENSAKFSIDNIKDIFTNIVYDIGKQVTPILTPIFKQLENYLKAFRRDEKRIKSLAEIIGGFAEKVGFLMKLFVGAVTFIGSHPFLIKTAAVIGGIVTAVSLAGTAFFAMAGAVLMTKLGMQQFGISTTGVTSRLGALKTSLTTIPWSGIATGVTVAITAFTSLYMAIKMARGEAARLSDIQETGMSLEQYGPASARMRQASAEIAISRGIGSSSIAEQLNNAKKMGTLNLTDVELAQMGYVSRNIAGISRIVPSELGEDEKIMMAAGVGRRDTDIAPIREKMMTSLQAGASAAQWRLTTPEAMMSQQAKYKSLASEYEVSNKSYNAAFGGLRGQLVSRYPQLAKIPAKKFDAIVRDALENTTPGRSASALASALNLATTGASGQQKLAGSMPYIAANTKAVDVSALTANLMTYFEQNAPTGTSLGLTSMRPAWRKNVIQTLQSYTEGLEPSQMKDLMVKTGGWKSKAFIDEQNPNAGTIASALKTGSDKSLYELIRYFQGANDKTDDILTDIKDNTKKVEELLPPIFREIFDKFTRRGMMAGQGRAAFLGAR